MSRFILFFFVTLIFASSGCTGGLVTVTGNPNPSTDPLAPTRPLDTEKQPLPSTAPASYATVEVKPALEGGLDGLARTIHYPEVARQAGIEGAVRIAFVVNTGGGVEQASVARGLGGGCEDEALRAVRVARFTPGREQGQAVSVKTCLEIRFRLVDQSISARYCAA